jgi:hypothetical protein
VSFIVMILLANGFAFWHAATGKPAMPGAVPVPD